MRWERKTRTKHLLALVAVVMPLSGCSLGARFGIATNATSVHRTGSDRSSRTITIPDLTGLTERQARDKLAAIGHTGRISLKDKTGCEWSMKVAEGSVCGSHPPAERTTKPGLPITLHIARSTVKGGTGRNAWIAMPDVIGMAPERAVEVLKKAGFADVRVQYSNKPGCEPPAKVCYTSPEPGKKSILRHPKDLFVAVDLPESHSESEAVATTVEDKDAGEEDREEDHDSETDSYFDD